jgi:hypothetical protein
MNSNICKIKSINGEIKLVNLPDFIGIIWIHVTKKLVAKNMIHIIHSKTLGFIYVKN